MNIQEELRKQDPVYLRECGLSIDSTLEECKNGLMIKFSGEQRKINDMDIFTLNIIKTDNDSLFGKVINSIIKDKL